MCAKEMQKLYVGMVPTDYEKRMDEMFAELDCQDMWKFGTLISTTAKYIMLHKCSTRPRVRLDRNSLVS
jgi:hypothetical protein